MFEGNDLNSLTKAIFVICVKGYCANQYFISIATVWEEKTQTQNHPQLKQIILNFLLLHGLTAFKFFIILNNDTIKNRFIIIHNYHNIHTS